MKTHIKKWQAQYDGDRVYAIRCTGPLWDDEEDEYPKYSSIPEGDMIITVLSEDIKSALQCVYDLIDEEDWRNEE